LALANRSMRATMAVKFIAVSPENEHRLIKLPEKGLQLGGL